MLHEMEERVNLFRYFNGKYSVNLKIGIKFGNGKKNETIRIKIETDV